MSATPLVSIVTAAYKTTPAHLRQALQSAVSQRMANIEILVSDDSPNDALREVVEAIADHRLTYRHRRPPLGVAANHWRSFSETRGKYIALLNHDDLFDPDFLHRLVLPLERDSSIALAFCDHWVIDESGHRLEALTDDTSAKWGRSTLRSGKHQPFYSLLAEQTIPMAMGAVFRREALPATLAENAGPAYDLWLTYYLARDGAAAFYVPERLSSWRTHPTNLTSAGGLDWATGAAACWETVAQDRRLASIRRAARRKAALIYSGGARAALRQGDRRTCARFAGRSLRMYPTWRGLAACAIAATGIRR